MMDDLSVYLGAPYKITQQISVRNPTIREISAYGEQEYFNLVHRVCATPADQKVAIWDCLHKYWDSIDEYELFVSTFRNIQKEDCGILFGDLDMASFRMEISGEGNSFRLANKDGAVIDRAVYKLLTDQLRKIHMLKKNVVKPYDDYTRDVLIEADRDDMADAEGKPFRSILAPLISSMTNIPGGQYTWENVWDVPIGTFMDSVSRVGKRDHYYFLMLGIYSGNVDAKKLNKKELDWMT